MPTYPVSAVFRPEQAFFKKRSAWYRCWLRWYTGIFVQDERSRRLLEDAGIEGAVVAGDTRFDRVADIRNAARDIPELSRFRDSDDRPIAVLNSSWPPRRGGLPSLVQEEQGQDEACHSPPRV